jgi:polyhydroxyalkanoate synthesis repressor PhaR
MTEEGRAKVSRRNVGSDGPITIKKYANRRLYNTATSSYVTLDHLSEMVKTGQDFVVYDAKTGEDITRSVLTQIIFEMEGKGQSLLPIRFLRQLIRFYGDSMQALVPGYLDLSMEAFSRNQEEFRKQLSQAFGGGAHALKEFESHVRNNMAMFERAMRIFSPFGAPMGQAGEAERKPEEKTPEARERELDALKERLEAMQRQLDTLSGKR